jgi:hypothetical protein
VVSCGQGVQEDCMRGEYCFQGFWIEGHVRSSGFSMGSNSTIVSRQERAPEQHEAFA